MKSVYHVCRVCWSEFPQIGVEFLMMPYTLTPFPLNVAERRLRLLEARGRVPGSDERPKMDKLCMPLKVFFLESITVSGPRLRRMVVCGWEIRSVSWIRASRTGASASQASNRMEARCDVSEVLAAASPPYVDSSSSVSRVALFFHSELLPRML